MLTEFQKEIEQRCQQSKERELQRFGDIYDECENNGCDLDFIKTFSTRMWFHPIAQTKCFVVHKAMGKLDQFRKRTPNSLEQWKIYLSVLIKLRPFHDKAAEWKESLEIIDYYEKTGKFKDSEPWGFWMAYIGENDYIDILFEQNGEDSEIIEALDREYDQIEKGCIGSEARISAIRMFLKEKGYSAEVERCDKEFIHKGMKMY